MPQFRHLCLVFAACFAGANSPLTAQTFEQSFFDRLWTLPILSLFAPTLPEPLEFEAPVPTTPPCLIEPLSEISDPAAQEFEAAVGTDGVVNTDGLTFGTSRALNRFEHLVVSAGGRVVVKSAYRPATYQAHLQELWDKWMVELRHNFTEECAPLRAIVWDEFSRHDLLESQRPATSSDHTRGLSFDAAVYLPRGARLGRRRVGIDSLARIAQLRRPAIASDPVHFKLI